MEVGKDTLEDKTGNTAWPYGTSVQEVAVEVQEVAAVGLLETTVCSIQKDQIQRSRLVEEVTTATLQCGKPRGEGVEIDG